jgi:tRNA isopentenyl-2-thiomethyl-A-37 hydroxylase MiaE
MIRFKTRIQKFAKQGEKTGWTYIEINQQQAQSLNPKSKKSFRVKGKLDKHPIEKQSLLPMGDGKYILPLNAKLRKLIGKKEGDSLIVELTIDKRKPELSKDLLACLQSEPEALVFFKGLTNSHQHYFSGWIESAKTVQTKTKRIVMAIDAFTKKQGFPEMLRANKNQN